MMGLPIRLWIYSDSEFDCTNICFSPVCMHRAFFMYVIKTEHFCK